MANGTILVAGAGGFIGGHLVADLLARGFTDIRAVDVKPFGEWYQVFDEAENVVGDLREISACRAACRGVSEVYNLAA
ncbi:MAG TPA: NAD-dependent epimerase/dehydratase family protein, partial [Pirellulales bacterium]|nr:NAD-dependent epimerase/dehydratase family protein [Pirellulales bacterium]